jgi:hypothetical protein
MYFTTFTRCSSKRKHFGSSPSFIRSTVVDIERLLAGADLHGPGGLAQVPKFFFKLNLNFTHNFFF